MFGENFTTDGLLEDSVHVGDRFSVGSAEVVVTQPRLPCYKLGIRFESDEMVKRFLASARTGFYLAVTRGGEVGAGDEIKLLSRDPSAVPVSEITRLYVGKPAAPSEANPVAKDKTFSDADAAVVHRALQVPAFPESWKSYLRDRLPKVNA
jgi:MOSC domain-containing protein YiiM